MARRRRKNDLNDLAGRLEHARQMAEIENLSNHSAAVIRAQQEGMSPEEIDRMLTGSVSSSVDVDVEDKKRDGQGGNLTVAGVNAMPDKEAMAKGYVRQGDPDDEFPLIPPHPSPYERRLAAEAAARGEEPAAKKPDLKVIQIDDTAEYTLSKLLPEIRKQAIVGYKALTEISAGPTNWAWRGIAADDHLVEVSGPTTSGKSTLVFMLAVASANATKKPVEVLGHEITPVPRGKFIILVEEENCRRSCALKLIASCQMLGLDPEKTTSRIVVLPRTGFRPDSVVAEEVKTLASQGHIGRIFLDSRARIFKGKANAEEDQADAARWAFDLINRNSGSIWVVSHTRKGSARQLDDVSGSQQRAASADTVVLVSSTQAPSGKVLASHVIFRKIRDEENDEHPEPVKFTIKQTNSGSWVCQYTSATKAETMQAIQGDGPTRDRLLDMLASSEDEMSAAEIRKALGIGYKKTMAIINTLAEEKLIRKKVETRGAKQVITVRLRNRGDFDSFEDLRPDGDDE